MESETREQIDQLIESQPIVLFMKGNRGAPQCGFSATVCQILDSMLPDYETFDVLSDAAVRDGIKEYSSWPTIPQLYVKGEFVGGCDIVRDHFSSGELQRLLGVEVGEVAPPEIRISEAAADALRKLSEGRPEGQLLHLTVDARFQNQMYFGPQEAGELVAEANGIQLVMSPMTAQRAAGLAIDAQGSGQEVGFAIQNPNAPALVQPLTPAELKTRLDAGDPLLLLDVRSPEERATASIEGSRLLDQAVAQELEGMSRDTVLVFHCHHGGRSQAAAEHFVGLGFEQVYNLTGGIEAWSTEIDPSVARY